MRRAAAGVLFVDKAGRILLVKPTYKSYWDLPGGIVEPDESPLDAAMREVKEELGIIVPIGKLLVADYFPATESISEAMMYVFEGTVPPDSAITLQADELSEYAWVYPFEITDLVANAPILKQRIYSARAAHIMKVTYFCERGVIKV